MKCYLNSCKAELLKVFTTRSWWVLALVMFVYLAFTAAFITGSFAATLNLGSEAVSSGAMAVGPTIYALAPTIGYLFPVLMGALSVTVEYKHGTMTPSFIWAGKRGRVLWSKVSIQFLMGCFYGVVGLVATISASMFFFLHAGGDTGLTNPETWLQFLRTLIDMGIWATVGVGVGMLVRGQAATIVIVVIFTQFLEPLVRLGALFNERLEGIIPYFPGAASDAFTSNSFYSFTTSGAQYDPLVWWAGGLLLLAYASLAVGIGSVTRWRGDIT